MTIKYPEKFNIDDIRSAINDHNWEKHFVVLNDCIAPKREIPERKQNRIEIEEVEVLGPMSKMERERITQILKGQYLFFPCSPLIFFLWAERYANLVVTQNFSEFIEDRYSELLSKPEQYLENLYLSVNTLTAEKDYPTNKKKPYSKNRANCPIGFEHYYYELVNELGMPLSAKRVLEETIHRIDDGCGFFESYDPKTDLFTTNEQHLLFQISSKTVQNWCSIIKAEIYPK